MGMIRYANWILEKTDRQIVQKSRHDLLLAKASKYRMFDLFETIDSKSFDIFLKNLSCSKAQLSQDLFVLGELGFKRNGFFVEFGATNGIDLSNTHLLEKQFGWQGILAEPAKIWHQDLLSNRSASIETDCVWTCTGKKLSFNEVSNGNSSELSTIDAFSEADHHSPSRAQGKRYEVNTISLIDMLRKYNAPAEVDYLSIDTEGSEYEILKAFDFEEYKIKIITCEHNYTPMREKIFRLLSEKGYERKYSEYSLWDDWYVNQRT